jgi:hypothetical protein
VWHSVRVTPTRTRETSINMRVTADLAEALGDLAEHEGVSRSEVIRRLMLDGIEALSDRQVRRPVRVDLDVVLAFALEGIERHLTNALAVNAQAAVDMAARAGAVLTAWAEREAAERGLTPPAKES